MPVTTTPEDVITAARLRSIKYTTATDATELFDVVNLAFGGIYSVAAKVNPYFFGDTLVVAKTGGYWERPPRAASIIRLELTAVGGTEVAVVDLGDKQAEQGMPAVYRFGQRYFSAGNANDPVAQDLVFWYARLPTVPVAVDDPLDPAWVEDFNPLLIEEVAIYLSLKDRRLDELGDLKAQRDAWLRRFVDFLYYETANVTKRHSIVKRVAIEELLPLLAGGQG